jgi:cytochrome c-type biogenesis protein CcsB
MPKLYNTIAILILSAVSFAQPGTLSDDPESRLSTIPHDSSLQEAIRESGLHLMTIQYEGWPETLSTFSRLAVYEATGRKKIHGQDPEYTALSMIYTPAKWNEARYIPVEHPDLLKTLKLDGKWVSPAQIRQSPGTMELLSQLDDADAQRRQLNSIRKRLNAVEQVTRLGRNDRVLQQFKADPMNPISKQEIETLLDNPDQVRTLHEKRQKLEAAQKQQRAYIKAARNLIDRMQVPGSLMEKLLIYPDSESINGNWLSPHMLPLEQTPLSKATAEFDSQLHEAMAEGDSLKLKNASEAFLPIIAKSRLYPTQQFLKAQNIYTKSNPWKLAAWMYLLSGLIFASWFFFRWKSLYWFASGTMLLGFVFNTSAVGLRLYLKGHIPVSNMFEAMTFCAWAVMLIAIIGEAMKRRGVIGTAATAMSFLFLAGAALMPLHETRIHPLRAVLNSYWLNIHVTMMLISYAAFAIAAVFAFVYLIRAFTGKEALKVTGISLGAGIFLLLINGTLKIFENQASTGSSGVNLLIEAISLLSLLTGWIGVGGAILVGGGYTIRSVTNRLVKRRETEPILTLDQTEEFAYKLVQFGWPVLTLGVALGAVWADTAWGRFWGWDPKETWAFITWVCYTVYLHTRMVLGWRGKWSAAVCILGFVMVLITWIGVSYLPWFSGGLHSYASAR